jgi:hypothetical protein
MCLKGGKKGWKVKEKKGDVFGRREGREGGKGEERRCVKGGREGRERSRKEMCERREGREGKEKKGVTVSCQVCVEKEEGDKSWSVSQPATTFIFKAMCTVFTLSAVGRVYSL